MANALAASEPLAKETSRSVECTPYPAYCPGGKLHIQKPLNLPGECRAIWIPPDLLYALQRSEATYLTITALAERAMSFVPLSAVANWNDAARHTNSIRGIAS